ncbi:hypothetical protein SeLEV6574_g07900, partial [Synchytrium endobioticum]
KRIIENSCNRPGIERIVVEDTSIEAARVMIDVASMQVQTLDALTLDDLQQVYELSERYEVDSLPILVTDAVVKNILNEDTAFDLLDYSEERFIMHAMNGWA